MIAGPDTESTWSEASEFGFGIADEGADLVGVLGGEQSLAQFGIAQQATDARQHGQVLGDGGGDEQEEQLRRRAVDCSVRNAAVVTAEDEDGLVHETDERIAGVREGDAVADAGAVEFLAFLQRVEEGFSGGGLAGEFRDLIHQFGEHVVALRAAETQVDHGGREQLAQRGRSGLRTFHAGELSGVGTQEKKKSANKERL
jgi:hypothetical protein